MVNLFEENQKLVESEVYPELQVAPLVAVIADVAATVAGAVILATLEGCRE